MIVIFRDGFRTTHFEGVKHSNIIITLKSRKFNVKMHKIKVFICAI